MFSKKLIVYGVDPLPADPKLPTWLINFFSYNFRDPFLGVAAESSFEKNIDEIIKGRLGGKIHTHVIDARDLGEKSEDVEFFIWFFVPNHHKDKEAGISSVSIVVVRAPDISTALKKLKNSTKASWLVKKGVSLDNLPSLYVNIKVALFQQAKIFQPAAG